MYGQCRNRIKRLWPLRYLYNLPGQLNSKIKFAFIMHENKKCKINAMGGDLRQFKDIYENQRCFIIGNGPSLTIQDLEMLDGECTMASNSIIKLYEKTTWRPTYYFSADPTYVKNAGEDLLFAAENAKSCFFCYRSLKLYHPSLWNRDNVFFYFQPIYQPWEIITEEVFRNGFPKFSFDITENIYSSGTVTYEMLQTAIYMGFKEIYLLGIDHSYLSDQKHFSGYDEKSVENNYPTELRRWEKSYERAGEVMEKKGGKIYNATRGGHLEVFERKNLEEILKGRQ